VVPIVTGHIDWTALDRLTETYLAAQLRAARVRYLYACALPVRACGGAR